MLQKRRITMKKGGLTRFFATSVLLVLSGVLLIFGCSEPVKTLDRGVKGPQIIVNPETVRLGVAKLRATNLVFSGSGFEPGDSVFISLLDVPINGKKVDVPVASADIKKDGTFSAKVGTLTKVSDFLRARIGSNEKMENIIIITRPPMHVGTYTAHAISMLSDRRAECSLKVTGPSLIDRIKDWIGGLLGKIVKK
jgi:hypothetical protein